jgi:hypothetical protein
MTKSAIILTGSAMLLTSCMTNAAGEPGVSTYYDCGNGTRLTVDSLPGDRIEVQMNDDEPVILPTEPEQGGKL